MVKKEVKKAEALSISDDIPNTVEYKGKRWIILDRSIMGNFNCKGVDEMRSPTTGFVSMGYVTPKEFLAKQEELKAKYSEVTQVSGQEITTLFREIINQKDGTAKQTESERVQRMFKDGKWNILNPIDVEKQLQETTGASLKENKVAKVAKTFKESSALVKAALIVAGAAIIALLGKIVISIVKHRGA